MLDAMGNLIQPQPARPLTVDELIRLRDLDLLVEPRECSTRFFEFGCPCDACLARVAAAGELGYTPSGQLMPRPGPPQPWEVKRPSRRAA